MLRNSWPSWNGYTAVSAYPAELDVLLKNINIIFSCLLLTLDYVLRSCFLSLYQNERRHGVCWCWVSTGYVKITYSGVQQTPGPGFSCGRSSSTRSCYASFIYTKKEIEQQILTFCSSRCRPFFWTLWQTLGTSSHESFPCVGRHDDLFCCSVRPQAAAEDSSAARAGHPARLHQSIHICTRAYFTASSSSK